MNFLKKHSFEVLAAVVIVAFAMTLIVANVQKSRVAYNSGQGSVPVTSSTDYSVDVCLNQECEYSADGQNDDKEIKQAITAVLAAGGGVVNIRAGDYNVSTPIEVSLSGESLIIKGDGYATKLTNSMTTATVGGTVFVITGDGSSLNYFAVRDMYFVGGSTSGAGLSLIDIYKSEVSDCKFTGFSASGNWATGIKADGLTELSLHRNLNNGNTNDIVYGDPVVVYTDLADNATLTSVIDVPTDGTAATSTGGTLDADTYYFKLTITDAKSGESLPSDEFSCTVGTEMSGTSTACIITWTDVADPAMAQIWVGTTTDVYYGSFAATTSATYFFATSTSLVNGTQPTENSASVVYFNSSGVENEWIETTMTDASTTLVAVLNPLASDLYLDQFLFFVTVGATSSLVVDCGTSSDAFTAPSDVLIDGLVIATSTTIKSFNTAAAVAGTAGFAAPGTNSENMILWQSGEYLVCQASENGSGNGTAGLTNVSNTFVGNVKIHSLK